MKRICMYVLAVLTMWCLAVPVSANDGNVVYDGNAREFIFSPGSNYSPTDLFPEFKGVMPGDSIEQKIMVKNTAGRDKDVKIYLRALGAHDNSIEFLSKLRLKVEKKEAQGSTVLFDANASEKAQLTDWVCLGSFESGEEAELLVALEVPVELDNTYSNLIGKLDWEFMVEEFTDKDDDDDDDHKPQEPDKPASGTVTPTGDSLYEELFYGGLGCVACMVIGIFLFVAYGRSEREKR